MRIKIFGRNDCSSCKAALRKISFSLEKWGIKDLVAINFYNIDTVDGLSESAYYGIGKIPTTLIEWEDGKTARWEGKLPEPYELRSILKNLL
jgi:thiol-disulfide isomerase/thioredoxin